DRLIEELYHDVKATKPWVKVGISPFGIWRPGFPPSVKGFDAYEKLYADARKWLRAGWLDYVTPQLYWTCDAPEQSYPALLAWWHSENVNHRHLWPGNFTSRVGDHERNWEAAEIIRQINATRKQPGATGNIHFSMRAFLRNSQALNTHLRDGPYLEDALVPESSWLSATKSSSAPLEITAEELRVVTRSDGQHALTWKTDRVGTPWLWLVQWRTNGPWQHAVIPGSSREFEFPSNSPAPSHPDPIALSAVGRVGTQGDPVSVRREPGNDGP
ncbi:MAG TPA: family 10 glycosylhydrolase, partial [Pirellulaceae bacterium]